MEHKEVIATGLYLNGIPWSVADNEHLLRWPGNLVGDDGPYATHAPRLPYVEATLAQQGYDHLFGDRTPPPLGRQMAANPHPVPAKAGKEWRDLLGDPPSRAVTYPALSPWRPGFARPSGGVAFEARQTVVAQLGDGRDVPHPYQELWETLIPPTAEATEDPDGGLWVLGILSRQILNAMLMRRRTVELLGAYGAGQALHRYLLADVSEDQVRTSLFRFQAQELDPLTRHIAARVEAVEQEMKAWQEAVRIPVCGVEGEIDRILSLVNLSTAAVAILNLGSLRDGLRGFELGARQALAGLQA